MELLPTSPEAIVRHFLDFDTWLGVAPIGTGNINDTYRVELQRDGQREAWLLQRLNHRVFTDPEGVMRNIGAIASHLGAQADFPLEVPVPLRTTAGGLLHLDEAGNYWRMFPFYGGTYAPERLPDPAVAFEAAGAYGAFLRALRDFPADALSETIPGFHDTDRRWSVFETVLASDPAGRLESVQAEVEALYAAQRVFAQISVLKRRGDLPLRVTHNDTKAGNVLLDQASGRAVAVIDWDTVMPGTVLSDFGDMVRTFAPDGPEDAGATVQVRLDVLEALCRGFMARTADFLTETERENLPLGALWIIGEQALRFLSDYLAGDVYYKIRYPEHNLIRTQNQLALFRAIQEQEGWLQQAIRRYA